MKTLLRVLIALTTTASALGQTYVTEDITTDTTWNLAGSPYVVQGNIDVDSSSTLTIEPGVVVELDTDSRLQGYYCSIVAIGTEGNEILFTSHSGTPAPGDWYSVYLYHSPAAAFSYCIFEYGQYNLYMDHCSPTVTFCTSRYAEEDGATSEDGSPTVESCNLIDNNRGIRIFGPSGNPVINYCNLYNNAQNMYVSSYTSMPPTTIDAEYNWWGVDDEVGIEATINILPSSDPYVDVDFDPWLHEVPVEEMSWARVKALFAD